MPTDTSLIYGFLVTIVINQLFDFSLTHTEDERRAEIERLMLNPDDIIIDLDSFIADQCVSEESIKSFRNVYNNETVQPADVARRVFALFERFPDPTLKGLKALALIVATTDSNVAGLNMEGVLIIAIDDNLRYLKEQDAQAALLN